MTIFTALSDHPDILFFHKSATTFEDFLQRILSKIERCAQIIELFKCM